MTIGRARARAEAAAELLLCRRSARRGAAARVFDDGQQLAGRYRVLELLEGGGSGQVYRVFDEELGEQIALKTLHPGVAATPGGLDRFKQEFLLARSVTHENVCRLFELGRHETADRSVLFLTMEWVEGQTLARLVARLAPLPLEQVVELGRQVALGLRAVHRKGVVHRDLKGQNVLVQADESGGLRAVLTDFGLATVPARTTETLPTGDGAMVGTPLTMAPEQVRGGPVGEATDIYSFGVLLYHLATGVWPFGGETPLCAAVSRLEKAPASPREHRPELPPALEALILDCLKVAPEARPRSVNKVLERLRQRAPGDEVAAAVRVTTSSPRRPVASRLARWTALAMALVLPVLWLSAKSPPALKSPPAPNPTETPSPRRPSLLWLGLLSHEPAPDASAQWLETLVTEGLSASLSATGELRLVAGEQAESIRREVGDLPPGPLGLGRVETLRRRAGVDHVLAGRVERAIGGQLRFKLELDAETAELSGLVSADDLAGLGDEVSSLAGQLHDRLSLEKATARQASSARGQIPSQPQAARLYAEGLAALRDFETRRAVGLLQESLEREPDHPKVLAALATSWMRLGYSHRAREAAERAFENAGGLSRAEQMGIEAFFRLRQRDWQRAAQLYAALWEFFPDEAGHGLGLVEAHDRAGELELALSTLEQLRARGKVSLPDQARIELAESLAAYHQGDYPRSQEAARRARQIGETLESPALVAEALLQEALTRISSDADLAEARQMLRRAIPLLEELGEARHLVLAQLYLADCARRQDRFKEAEQAYRRAIETAAAVGNNADLDRARTSLAILLDRRGSLHDGLVLKQQVLQSYRERRFVQGAVIAQENIAISLLKMGQPAAALEQLAEVEQRYTELGDRIGLAWSPYYQGRAWLDRGELMLADRHLRRARESATSSDLEAPARDGLLAAVDFEQARLAWTRGDLGRARELAEPLIDFYEGLERPFDIAETRLLLAGIARGQERWQDAEAHARLALEHFISVGIIHQEVAARAELAEIEMARLLARPTADPNRMHQACAELTKAPELEHRRFALLAAVTSSRCRLLGTSPAAETLAALAGISAEARTLELFLPELRAEILRLERSSLTGPSGASLAELEALRSAARERGFSRQASNGIYGG